MASKPRPGCIPLPGPRTDPAHRNRSPHSSATFGIELELEEADVVATVGPRNRERKANWYLGIGPPSKKAVEPRIALFNAGKGGTPPRI